MTPYHMAFLNRKNKEDLIMMYTNCFPFHPDLEEAMRNVLAQGFHPYEIYKDDEKRIILNADISYSEFLNIQNRAIGEKFSMEEGYLCVPPRTADDDGYEFDFIPDRYYSAFLGSNFCFLPYDKVKPYILFDEKSSDEKEVLMYEYNVPHDLAKFVRIVLVRNFYQIGYMKNEEDFFFSTNADPDTFRKICARANCEKYGWEEKDSVRYFTEEELADPDFMKSIWILQKSDLKLLPISEK